MIKNTKHFLVNLAHLACMFMGVESQCETSLDQNWQKSVWMKYSVLNNIRFWFGNGAPLSQLQSVTCPLGWIWC